MPSENQTEATRIQITRITAESSPLEIWNTPSPPTELFVQGSVQALELLQKLPERGLAIVGTRSPLPRSISLLKKWMSELEGTNLIIVSGLARGIDAIAHAAALDAGLPTIAILGAGLDLNYPRENEELRARILESNGLIISEFPLKTPALGHHFLQRNRLIAAWANATWVVEAGAPSGALSTARWARELDRTCFALPCYPGDPAMKGNQTLLDRDHALTFWGVHSLGAVWIELASLPQNRKKTHDQNAYTKNSPEIAPLITHLVELTHRRGGAPVQELLDWGLSQGWTPEQLFTSLRTAIEQKKLIEHQGVLVST